MRMQRHLQAFFKLLWIFAIASFVGDMTETLFCRLKSGVWMSRSSLVWGQFSIVWGGALVLLALLLRHRRCQHPLAICLIGTLAGALYEYACSLVSERLFGVVFWDYSNMPFNLAGRVNLLYSVLWGIAAVIWLKLLYPPFSYAVDCLLHRSPNVLSALLALFMLANLTLSGAALTRYTARSSGCSSSSSSTLELLLDKYFPDSSIERIYPNLILKQVTQSPNKKRESVCRTDSPFSSLNLYQTTWLEIHVFLLF